MNDKELAVKIARKVAGAGGTAYYVGGYVRDRLLGIDNKDIDIEIHGIAPSMLEDILDSVGERINIGESFGIYSIKGYSVDIAMPRKEECRGKGHKDFDIYVDPFAGTYNASIRRDFTINALMEDVLTGDIIDHYGGQEDLKNGIIRHVNDKSFAEDELRVLRAAQFAARFGYSIADDTVKICQNMTLDNLPSERVYGELKKAFLKADKPSVFFEVLRQVNQLDYWFPELKALIGVEQSPKYHAEGDCWIHTMMVIDQAALNRDKASNPLAFMLSALMHDYGKAITTTKVDGVIHAYGHETKGLPLVESGIKRITTETEVIKYVLNMVELHMLPNVEAKRQVSVKSTNKMFDRSIDPLALVYFAESDHLGRICECDMIPHTDFLLERLGIYLEYMSRPYVMGRDLIDAGIKPSARFGEYLDSAHKLRLAGIDKESALKQVLAMARKGERKK